MWYDLLFIFKNAVCVYVYVYVCGVCLRKELDQGVGGYSSLIIFSTFL